jgi:hypothetical protein
VKFAVVIGSFDMPDFIELQIRALRRVFGEQTPILVSDDLSQHSVEIRDVAAAFGVHHVVSETHRSHFCGDAQAICNGLAFAECEKADVLVKVSQRFVLIEPVIREILENYFQNPETWLVLPGRIHPGSIKRAESRFFSNLSVQSDVVAVRTWKLRPSDLKNIYEERVRSKKSRHDSLIEALWAYLMDVTLNGHTVQAPELTHRFPGRSKLFLRRCQSEPGEYLQAAESLGMRWPGVPKLQEWRQLTNCYRPVGVLQ